MKAQNPNLHQVRYRYFSFQFSASMLNPNFIFIKMLFCCISEAGQSDAEQKTTGTSNPTILLENFKQGDAKSDKGNNSDPHSVASSVTGAASESADDDKMGELLRAAAGSTEDEMSREAASSSQLISQSEDCEMYSDESEDGKIMREEHDDDDSDGFGSDDTDSEGE